jgi:hypothetical protein
VIYANDLAKGVNAKGHRDHIIVHEENSSAN